MPHPTRPQTKSLAQEQRRARLAAELRANLRKRKAHARSRAPDASEATQGRDRRQDEPDAQEAARTDTRGPTGEVA
jgi:hypothetical protein